MSPLERFMFRTGLTAALNWLRSGGRGGVPLFNHLRQLFPGFTQSQYGAATTYGRDNFIAARRATSLAPSERMPVSLIPIMPDLAVDAALGERYRAVIDIEFHPTPEAPTLVRRTYWTGTRAPTGRDLAEHVAAYLARQLDLWGETPGSEDMEPPDEGTEPESVLIGWEVVQINAL